MEREITVTIKLTDKIIAQLMGVDGDISEQWDDGDIEFEVEAMLENWIPDLIEREITTTPGGLGLR